MPALISRWEGKVLALYGSLIRATGRFKVTGFDHLDRAVNGPCPTVIAAWHGQTHLLLGYLSGVIDLSRFVIIVPDDHRREVLESFARAIGGSAFAVAMSDESFAGARRLLQLIRGLRERGLCYINPDGPDGPARVPKPGIALIAEKSGGQILPVGAEARPCLRQRRWDRYILPLPFARVSIAFRPAFPAATRTDRETWMSRLSQELTAAKDEAVASLARA
jgi:lysophospholipid acyltransferase (LPLAT)-like uncharacterized protein